MNPTFSEDGRELIATRVLPWAPAEVCAAWLDPQRLALWWGPRGFSNTFETCEPRPGGDWRFVMHGPDGKNYPNQCVFVEVEAPSRIVIEHLSDPHFVLTATFEPMGVDGQQTRLMFRQRFDSARICTAIAEYAGPGNEDNLDRLTAVLESSA